MKTYFHKFYAKYVKSWYSALTKRQAHKRARKYDVNKDYIDQKEPRRDEDGDLNRDEIRYRKN